MDMFNRFGETRRACFGKTRLVRSSETRFARFYCHTALFAGALLLCVSFVAHADDIQDANKLFKQGQHAQALSKVDGYLASKPKDAQARFLKGLIFTEQGKTNDAIKTFSALTEDYPELPEPYNNLAVLYASQGQYDKAKQSLEMAIRTHPSYATAHENLGDIYAKMASQAYDRALQLDRGNATTQTKLAMIQDLFASNTRSKVPAPARNTPTPATAVASAPEPAKPETIKPEAAASTTAKPAPAEKSAGHSPAANNSDELLKTVNAWAAAWSSKNVQKYLSFYAPDFRTPDGESRSAWAAAREERIKKPKSIRVGISNASVSFSDTNHATVKFHQSYRASHLKISGNKTLLMVKSGSNWLIQEERAK